MKKLKKVYAFLLAWHMASVRHSKNLPHFNVIEDLNK